MFFSRYQCYDRTIALLKLVYYFDLVSLESDVAHGPLVSNEDSRLFSKGRQRRNRENTCTLST